MAPDVQAIIDAICDPAIVLSRDYRIVFANSAYVERYGMDTRRPGQRLCYEVSHGNSVPCDRAGEHCPLAECLATGETARVLHVHHTPGGEEYVNVETWPVRGKDGAIEHFVEVSRVEELDAFDHGNFERKFLVRREPQTGLGRGKNFEQFGQFARAETSAQGRE